MEKNLELRDYQEAIISRAVEAISNGHNVIINAPTGTGKTIMTLEILRRVNKTGWVYVRTISQYSAWERDARKLGLSFTGLMRKGEFCKVLKKPYLLYCSYCNQEVDEKDTEHLRKHKKFIERKYISPRCYDPDAIPKWAAFCHYRPEYISRRFEDQKEAIEFVDAVSKKMKELVEQGGIKFAGNWFRDNQFRGFNVCIYKMIEYSTWIRIYSYIYFFLGMRVPKEGSFDDVIVFDEAHNLDDFNINSITLTKREVLGFFNKIIVSEVDKEKLLREVEEDFEAFIEDPERGFTHLGLIEQADEELAQKFAIIVKAWKESDKWFIERDQQEGYIKAMPADPALWLSNLNNYRYILLSGTMPSADYLRTVWGLNNFEYINAMAYFSSTSLKDHFAGAKLFVDDTIYYIKENRQNLRKKVVEVIQKYAAKDGLNLVVLPSYEDLEAYKSLLFGNVFFEDIRPDVLEKVKKLPDGYIIFAVAGGKLSEGIEVLDSEGRSRIKSVFIVGLPIPEYKNPYLEKMINVVARRVGRDPKSFKWTVLYEKAVIKVRQALGRAIRGPQDSANIYLLDKRFTYKNVIEKMGLESEEK